MLRSPSFDVSFFSAWFKTGDNIDENKMSIVQWLESINLTQYYHLFVQSGFKDMATIKQSMNDSTLNEIGIHSIADRFKIVKSVNELILTDILKSNHLTTLDEVLKQNDIDLDMIRSDLKLNESKAFCEALKFSDEQTQLFTELVKIVHCTAVDSNKISSPKRKIKQRMKMELILLGNTGVGKTCLVKRYVSDAFENNIEAPTLGLDFVKYKEILSDDTEMQIEIWDTAGQEAFHSISRSYYKSADAILVCFDVGIRQNIAYEHCTKWTHQIDEYGREDVVVIFVGCKGDISVDNRNSVEEKAEEMMERFGKLYCECSSKTGENVRNVFLTAAELVMKQRMSRIMHKKQRYNNFGRRKNEDSVTFETSVESVRINGTQCMTTCL